MALKKQIEINNTGVFAEYWRLGNLVANFHDGKGSLTVFGYVNQQARVDGKNPIHEMHIEFDPQGLGFPFDFNNDAVSLGQQLYAWLKNHPNFQGALDV